MNVEIWRQPWLAMSDPATEGFYTTATDPEDFDRYADGWSDGG